MQNSRADTKASCRLDFFAGAQSTSAGSSEMDENEFAVIPNGIDVDDPQAGSAGARAIFGGEAAWTDWIEEWLPDLQKNSLYSDNYFVADGEGGHTWRWTRDPAPVRLTIANGEVTFDVTDNAETVRVSYTGILPDLFGEGQGVVTKGRMGPDGVFVAEVPALPGCLADGHSREEALRHVREAISLYLESLESHGDPIPPPITEEVVEVAV